MQPAVARTAVEERAQKKARGASKACLHCASPTGGRDDGFCCEGCHHVYDLLQGQGLARYYALRGAEGVPVLERARGAADDAWIDLAIPQASNPDAFVALSLDVEGIHCTACVWLIEEVFRRLKRPGRITVNPALGTIELSVRADFPLHSFGEQLFELGYRLGPRRKELERRSDDLIWRIGVCVAIAMNAMIFAIARYAGLEAGSLERLFLWLELGLAIAAFAVGGIVFVKAAARGLVRGMIHLDLPIAVGLVLGYAGSIASLLAGDAKSTYFDTLIVFTTLMLVGRFLRERVLEKNRAQLLADSGIDGLLCRKIEGGRVVVTPVTEIRAGDELLIAAGDVVPVASRCEDAEASFSFDWITGESDARVLRTGEAIAAGAANAGSTVARLHATEPFAQSRLVDLLRAPRAAARYGEAPSAFEQQIAGLWVPAVIVAAAGGFALRIALGAGTLEALSVAIAVLVVTCPCAFGIATPIANELVLGGLRKRGLLVRSATFLERATTVRRVVFDKTGTLTTGDLRLASQEPILALDAEDRDVLYNLVCRSSHPKAAAIKAGIPVASQRFIPNLPIEDVPGSGVRGTFRAGVYRLGAPSAEASYDVELTKNGATLATLTTVEELRADAVAEVAGLAEDGLDVWMLTGDRAGRANATAKACGLPPAHVVSERTPEDKAEFIRALDREDTLMIGDGVNDGPAVQVAHCSGTPAAGRAFLASRADFYLLAAGLGPIRLGLRAARALRRSLRRNLVWAAVYNGIALYLSYAGLMTPLLCAVLMPCSSLVSIALVTTALGPKGSLWRS